MMDNYYIGEYFWFLFIDFLYTTNLYLMLSVWYNVAITTFYVFYK